MPFKSKAQRRWAYANKPEMAREFESETPPGKDLPERVGKKKNGNPGEDNQQNPYEMNRGPGADQPTTDRQSAYRKYLQGRM